VARDRGSITMGLSGKRADTDAVRAAPNAGADLRAARERLGWPLPDASATLRIRPAYLQALEEGDLSRLPGNAFALGFLRTYASALGLDPEEMLRRFKAESAEVSRRTELSFPAPVPERGMPMGAVILLGLILAVGAYIGWYPNASPRWPIRRCRRPPRRSRGRTPPPGRSRCRRPCRACRPARQLRRR
jgi:cytoskeleton protein RodZ